MCLQNSEIECLKVHVRRLEDKVRLFLTNMSLNVVHIDILYRMKSSRLKGLSLTIA